MMEIEVQNVRRSVEFLLAALPAQCSNDKKAALQEFLKISPEKCTEADIQYLFGFLSAILLQPDYTKHIAVAFEEYLMLFISLTMRVDDEITDDNFIHYQKICMALAELMCISSDAQKFALFYFANKPPPFKCLEHYKTAQRKNKRIKTANINDAINSGDLIKCCYQLLSCNAIYFKQLWNWAPFIEQQFYTKSSQDLQRFYCFKIMAILSNMSIDQFNIMDKKIPESVKLKFDLKHNKPKSMKLFDPTKNTKNVHKIILNLKSDEIVNIEGVLLPIFNKENYKFYAKTDGFHQTIVKVDSTKDNLRSIALGIAASKAICLAGPVGCGKTTLVEYLACKTGRIVPKLKEITIHETVGKENQAISDNIPTGSKRKVNETASANINDELEKIFNDTMKANTNGFLRIQLGDQTDSKLLLGQYHCTDVPGEFIWLPGALTQAVINGYWLLLEDLDAATQDVYTILSGLLEHNYLSVPGYRDCLRIAPGFQLFFTMRTNKSNTAQKLYTLLEKYLYTINILPLSRNELCKIISTNYPKLSTVANRIVDIYLTFSSGDHSKADNLRQLETEDKADTTEKFISLPFEQVSLSSLPNSGRLVSTRDLIKLCERSNPMFETTNFECAHFVFQNAVDLFCSYLPEGKEKTKLITSVGAKLGSIRSRCEYYAEEYKPTVEVDKERVKVGRVELFVKFYNVNKVETDVAKRQKLNEIKSTDTFSFTRMSSCILERIAVCIQQAEPVLLVGETGVGKTSSVQYLAARTEHKLVVVNMNNQSDVSDLIGGYKPVDLEYVINPLHLEFEKLMRQAYNTVKNSTFFSKFATCMNGKNYETALKLMLHVIDKFIKKDYKNMSKELLKSLPAWNELDLKVKKLYAQLSKSINISFAFIAGSLVNCIKNGDWILLDEINLSSAETLECLSTILEPDGSVVILEKGDFTPVKRHSDFRIFACMNPNTDIGKKDLPTSIRNRFTEFFVDELTTDADLTLLTNDYLSSTGIQKKCVANIVKLYKKLRQLSQLELNDGLGNRPVFSLRTLCRALRVCAKNLCGSIERNLYESFCMSFLTQLDATSHNIVLQLIKVALLSNEKSVLKQGIPKPGENYLNFEGYWIKQGPKELQECNDYILTTSVKENLRDLARIISIGKIPILLQGPTSAGKTSLIEYIAKCSGNYCLRINNHEHTDLQEYIGAYTTDVNGKLSFKEGVLVQAMRMGYWIILDELNLAPTDILEALNRVLDDNRELFIPETQKVVNAHENFMLFATQNPPGLYGGRKTLSRAFKNRFIELHFSEIPRNELEIILEKRCQIPTSYAKKMVLCMADLQKNRKTTTKNVFTLRDLFRWGNRYTYADKTLLNDNSYDWNQHLIEEGYMVLSAKVRSNIELEIIEIALHKNFKKTVDQKRLFNAQKNVRPQDISPVTRNILNDLKTYSNRNDIIWTHNMTRMAVMTAKALEFNEPVLLVGPTGCGKTTICQILSEIHDKKLSILNCHMHTEGADFLGGLRPCRNNNNNNNNNDNDRNEKNSSSEVNKLFEWVDGPLIESMKEGSYFMADEISLSEDSVLERLNCVLEPERTLLLAEKCDITANSDNDNFIIKAKKGFQFLATMNPGGDFGKKELSPALRNRFTEIWCLPSNTKSDQIQIAARYLKENPCKSATWNYDEKKIAAYMIEVVHYIQLNIEKFKYSIRDIISWTNYIVYNETLEIGLPELLIFGLETIFLDSLELIPFESAEKIENIKKDILSFAIESAKTILNKQFTFEYVNSLRGNVILELPNNFGIKPFYIKKNPQCIYKMNDKFLFDAPTTKQNVFRLLSAMSLKKPILLEGPPGVGKTSIVENIAAAIGYKIVRINLCEHTDMSDLFGTDLPKESNLMKKPTIESDASLSSDSDDDDDIDRLANGVDGNTDNTNAKLGGFVWRDGPLLAALNADNTFILLDEMNLAPQSVLEGLNAILDHRGEVFIPELNKTFILQPDTYIFACQNPLKQGGGRKGLPQSFLNRFTKVYLKKLTNDDLLYVVSKTYEADFVVIGKELMDLLKVTKLQANNIFDAYKMQKQIQKQSQLPQQQQQQQLQQMQQNLNATVNTTFDFDLPKRLVEFSEALDKGIANMEFGYKGGPFEINLRDILRWCELITQPQSGVIINYNKDIANETDFGTIFLQEFERFLLIIYERMKLVYYQRMRTEQDKTYIRNVFGRVFNCNADALEKLSKDVSLYWTADKIYLNDIVLNRKTSSKSNNTHTYINNETFTLLLNSQREILKNIIECAQVNRPVLLCGATDTGKTKLVDAVCTLSNELCNTDIIDDSVTGSFQQIDVNRHFEKIVKIVELFYHEYLQNNFIFDSPHQRLVVQLMNLWSNYTNSTKLTAIQNTAVTDMSSELNILNQRIMDLKKLTNFFKKPNNLPINYQTYLAKLDKYFCCLKNTKTLNMGGAFEWVDSKIVESLKYGNYILLEHVNLCSSAVLDRLNSVFEPNGCLLLSEKGVTANDSAEVVKKHKNFRAFLTIDPKNGELSRAMRNRCVELALNKDNAYDVDDKRLLIYTNGVQNIEAINCILRIHERNSKLTEICNFNITHLTRFAFLVGSYKRIGYTLNRAIYVGAMEVYVYSANTDLMGYGLDYYQNALRKIVIEETQEFAKIKFTIEDLMSQVILNCDEMNENTLIKLQMVPLKVLMMKTNSVDIDVKQMLSSVFNKFQLMNFANLEPNNLLNYYVYLLFEISSLDDLDLRYNYLQQFFSDNEKIKDLIDNFYSSVQQFHEFIPEHLSCLPVNPKMFPRIRAYNTIAAKSTKHCNLSALLIANLMLNDVTKLDKELKIEDMNFIEISNAITKNKLPRKIKDDVVINLFNFIENFALILKSSKPNATMNIKDIIQLFTKYLWFNRLLESAQKKFYIHNKLNKDALHLIHLHFKWLYKHLLQTVAHIFPNYRQSNAEFDKCCTILDEYMEKENQTQQLYTYQKLYQRHMIDFQPFFKEEQVQQYNAIDLMENFINDVPYISIYPPYNPKQKLHMQTNSKILNLRAKLDKITELNLDYKFKNIDLVPTTQNIKNNLPAALTLELQAFAHDFQCWKELSNTELSVQNIFDETKDIVTTINNDEDLYKFSLHKTAFGLLPLREHLLDKVLIKSLCTNMQETQNHINIEYCKNIHSLSIATMQLINFMTTEKYKLIKNVWHNIMEFLVYQKQNQQINNFEILFEFLNGGYKNLSTSYHLLLNAVQQQHLTNLSRRIDYVISSSTNCTITNENDLRNQFEGSTFAFAIIAFNYRMDGKFKSIPLNELENWKTTLKQLKELIWCNAALITPVYNLTNNKFVLAFKNSKKLLHEINFICAQTSMLENNSFLKLLTEFQVEFLQMSNFMQINEMQNEYFRNQQMEYYASLQNIYIGVIQLNLYNFMPNVDPVIKNRLKYNYLNENLSCLRHLSAVYDFMRIIMNYEHLGAEIYDTIQWHMNTTEIKLNRFSKKIANRPELYPYKNLQEQIMHFLTTICAPQHLQPLINNIVAVCSRFLHADKQDLSLPSLVNDCEELIKKVDILCETINSFLFKKLQKYASGFQDFIQPLKCSIQQLHFGLDGIKMLLTQFYNAAMLRLITQTVDIYELQLALEDICAFPRVNNFKILAKNIYDLDNNYATLLTSQLTDINNQTIIGKQMNCRTFIELNEIFMLSYELRETDDENKRMQKFEEESLYVHKTLCKEVDEDVQEMEEIEEMFATHAALEDFKEFTTDETREILENRQNQMKKATNEKEATLKTYKQNLTDDDYIEIVKNFINIFCQHTYTAAHYKPRTSQLTEVAEKQTLDFITPFKDRMTIFVRMFMNYRNVLNSSIDSKVFNSLAYAIELQNQMLEQQQQQEASKTKKMYNFYKDSNVMEIVECHDLLNEIQLRVIEQLNLYPEHATLIDINTVITRIQQLPATSAIIRFNTGFQILRQKLSQWNEVAHSGNNLRIEEQKIASYVQKWTKLELQYWRNCLTQTKEKVEKNAYKYWQNVMSLCKIYTENTNGEKHKLLDVKCESPVDLKEYVNILRQFMETSTYGDFHIRMQLLLSFELYLHTAIDNFYEKADFRCNYISSLMFSMHNLRLYFMQFNAQIEEHHKNIRTPIEKKLKDLVKIESYNKDLSYFSMRNNVARVHRNLNKILKEYEKGLATQITNVFQPQDATVKDYEFEWNSKWQDVESAKKLKYYMLDVHYFLVPEKQPLEYNELPMTAETATFLPAENEDRHNTYKIYKNGRKIVNDIITKTNYTEKIIALDDLLTDHLTGCDHLRNLTVDRTKERSLQVKEAKQILQQKRKALTDLFKSLTQLGISYKAGLMELSLKNDFENIELPIFCIENMLCENDTNNFYQFSFEVKNANYNTKLRKLNMNLDKYFYKSLFKLRLLQNIMLTPLSELGPPNIERIKGFAVDMFLFVQKQRVSLAKTTKDINNFRRALNDIKSLKTLTDQQNLLSKKTQFPINRKHFEMLEASLCRIRYVFEQFELLLTMAPYENVVANNTQQLLLNEKTLPFKDSAAYNTITAAVSNILKLTKMNLDDLAKTKAASQFTNSKKLKAYEAAHAQIVILIRNVREQFLAPCHANICDQVEKQEYMPIVASLTELLQIIDKTAFDNDNESLDAALDVFYVQKVAESVDVIKNSTLLPIQNLYKKYTKTIIEHNDDMFVLMEQHLKHKLQKELEEDYKTLNLSQLTYYFKEIIKVFNAPDVGAKVIASKLKIMLELNKLLPIIEQYSLLVDYFLLQQLAVHKISVKMLSIMLTAFVEISTKGFCVPPDLMQDVEGQAKQEKNSGDGFGMEDGTEGENDVSDKIESEDQLDDAKRPEDRNKDENEQEDCKEVKGIDVSEDFEGKTQDKEKNDDESDNENSDDENEQKEMGETDETANDLDEQLWGNDSESEEEDEKQEDMKEKDEGKGTKDEKDAHNDLDTKNDAAKNDSEEQETDGLDATNEPQSDDKRKQQEKDIDNMKEPEMDEEQVNPYHNQLEEPPEAEEMDLGDLNNDEQEGDEEQNDDTENPFDIDAMKEHMVLPETEDNNDNEDDKEEDEKADNNDDDDDDTDSENENDTNAKPDDTKAEKEEENVEENTEKEDKDATEKPNDAETNTSDDVKADVEQQEAEQKDAANSQEESKDKSSKEENVQAMPETDNKGSTDQVECEENEKNVKQDQKLDEQETGEEKDGVGQAENEETDGGHQGVAEAKEKIAKEDSASQTRNEEKRKQGRTDEERTLGEADKNKLKQLKTIDKLKEQKEKGAENEDDNEEMNVEAEEYQHVKEPKNNDKVTLDNATEEQSKNIKHQEDEQKETPDETENADIDESLENTEDAENKQNDDDDDEALKELDAELFEQKSKKAAKKSEHTKERAETQEQMEVDGEYSLTMTVPRGDDTTAHCNLDILLDQSMQAQELSGAESLELRKMYQEQLFGANSNKNLLPQHEDFDVWQTISNRMSQNARELCEQLRLILEPTKCTRLKGDYRTGRRINMKKIIPYIASQFRKDKIWLRRTKPAQRDYKITIAIDDSKSMHHNNSKTLTLEAISLVSQALTLLESGRLSVLSFGETAQIILNHTEQFDGPKLVKALNFEQNKTKIAELLDFVRTINTEETGLGGDNGLFENLLLVLSDGRNIYSEGKIKVRNAVKLAHMQRIFLVYIIIDNPENKNSILDVQTCEILPDKSIFMKSYLDDFPFPYYVIVRDLNQLPLVLSEAMRQWFELVNSE